MNNDSISRQAAIDMIMGQPPEPHYPSWYAEQIKALPSAQPRKGKWIYYDPNGFKCLRCGRYLEIECGDVKMNFCPHCGSYNGDEHNE